MSSLGFAAVLTGALLSAGSAAAQGSNLPFNPFGADGETFLVPVGLFSPLHGAYGTQWVTDFSMLNRGTADTQTIPNGINCRFLRCTLPPGITASVAGDGFNGSWLFVRKADLSNLSLQLCIRELTRDPKACTQLPFVRISDFQNRLSITNVVAGDRLRYDLRVYLLEARSYPEGPINATVTMYSVTGTTPDVLLGRATFALYLPDVLGRGISPGFLRISDLRSVAPLHDGDHLRIDVALENPELHLWTFLSIVDNETQRLTVLTP